ncbi:MAG: DUF4190 domain-containing protein [Ilumatobacteraceae bacterium]
METRATTTGWHADPWGRFEYRYFNGVQWTSDVAVNGQRYVDSPIEPRAPQLAMTPSRAFAITSFVTGIAGVTLGWIPFIFVIATGAAVAAVVFGILGLRAARRHDGYGRGFAMTGLVLSPFALAVCVGGFLFTRAVVHEIRAFVDPGPHELMVETTCSLEGGIATLRGTIQNLDDRMHDYRIAVEFTSPREERELATARVADVKPDETAPWSASAPIVASQVTCKVTDVFGPLPFNVNDEP